MRKSLFIFSSIFLLTGCSETNIDLIENAGALADDTEDNNEPEKVIV